MGFFLMIRLPDLTVATGTEVRIVSILPISALISIPSGNLPLAADALVVLPGEFLVFSVDVVVPVTKAENVSYR